MKQLHAYSMTHNQAMINDATSTRQVRIRDHETDEATACNMAPNYVWTNARTLTEVPVGPVLPHSTPPQRSFAFETMQLLKTLHSA